MDQENKTRIALFENKEIRKELRNNEWWFSILDVITALTDSPQSKTYWAKMKERDKEMSQPFPFWEQLKLEAQDGKMRETDCANTEGILRIVQSIPSPKAEPFKRWLAKTGYERIQEIEDPELAAKRTRAIYRDKGYSEAWIEKRMRGIEIREELTEEWKKRGVKEGLEYSILTSEISKATFGMTPNEYKNLKSLKRENLRDHMTDLELIFNMLGEKVTTEISQQEEPETFNQNVKVAKRGGNVAGNARKETEKELGRSIISEGNFIGENVKKLIL